MSPALTPLVSALERAATLIEKGTPPGKALRQVAKELEDYEKGMSGHLIPHFPFTERLGVPLRSGS
jgi:hypothetical protein